MLNGREQGESREKAGRKQGANLKKAGREADGTERLRGYLLYFWISN
jgi:hypothetical protein